MNYKVQFDNVSLKKKFIKNLHKIANKKTQDAIMAAVESLAQEPRSFGTKPFRQLKPPLEIYQFVAHYRIRVGDYRVLYDVDDEKKIVWIIALRKRSETTYKAR